MPLHTIQTTPSPMGTRTRRRQSVAPRLEILLRRSIGLLLLAGLAACESSSAPERPPAFDSAAALADYQSLDHVFASDGWTAFSAMAGRTPSAIGGGARVISAMSALSTLQFESAPRADGGRRMALALLAALAESGDASSASTQDAILLISDEHLGSTFVYDAETDQYVVDASRGGAPSNGVRFVLYAVDGQGRPIGAEEIGYADLLDEGSASDASAAIRLVAVERGTTVLDYRTEVVGGDGSGRIDVTGFVVDDQNRLDFTVEAEGSTVAGRPTVDLDFDLGIVARAFSVIGAVRGVEDGLEGEGTVALTVRHGTQSLQVDMDGDGQTIDGVIRLNGQTFITVSGDPRAPTLLGAQGDPITGAELLVVLRIVDTVDDVFDLVEDLLQPVDNLIALGWLL